MAVYIAAVAPCSVRPTDSPAGSTCGVVLSVLIRASGESIDWLVGCGTRIPTGGVGEVTLGCFDTKWLLVSKQYLQLVASFYVTVYSGLQAQLQLL